MSTLRFLPLHFAIGQVLSVSGYDLENGRTQCKEEVVYVTIGNLAFCLFLYLTEVHFRGELQHVGDVIFYQVLTNQNSRNRWYEIVRRTMKNIALKTWR